MTGATRHAPMPVIVGSPRSGTTLLRLMIDAHPEIASPPETGFLDLGPELIEGPAGPRENFLHRLTHYPADAPNWPDFHLDAEALRAAVAAIEPFDLSEALRAFYRLYAARFGKSRWGEKTPMYCLRMDVIEQVLPEARFIHVVRDGRDVAVSLREQWFSPGHDIAIQADYWRSNVLTAHRLGASRRHYMEVRYEDLIHDTQAELRRVSGFLGVGYHDCMLDYHRNACARLAEHHGRHRLDGSVVVSEERRRQQQAHAVLPPNPARIGLWKDAFSSEEKRRFLEIAGDALAQFGYAPD